MIKHIVFWKFADHAEGADKAANLERAREEIAGLAGLVPGLRSLEVAIGADPLEHSYDLVLCSEFDSVESLQAYIVHPRHQAVAGFISKVRTERACMDYEVAGD